MVKIRELSDEDLGRKRGNVPGMDRATGKEPEGKAEFTQSDFEAALKKASRKVEK